MKDNSNLERLRDKALKIAKNPKIYDPRQVAWADGVLETLQEVDLALTATLLLRQVLAPKTLKRQ